VTSDEASMIAFAAETLQGSNDKRVISGVQKLDGKDKIRNCRARPAKS